MKEFYRYLKLMQANRKRKFVLATVIRVDGSAYRHEGAKMLFSEDGGQYGTISAGCLEEDLLFHAREVLETKEPKQLVYDLRSEDDLGWGQGAGCNGKIEVCVEPISWEDHEGKLWPFVMNALEDGQPIACARGMAGPVRGAYLCMTNSETIGNIEDSEMDQLLRRELKDFFKNESVFSYKSLGTPDNHILFERYEPKDLLYIFGAGPDAEPLVKWASQLDFSPIVIDPRAARCNHEHFPDATALFVQHPEAFLATHSVNPDSYVLIMTHNFLRDQQILSHFIAHRPKYVGVLGPKKRTERLVHPHPLPDWVHSPIGVNIHAEGPEEISISILAELIQVRNAKRAMEKQRKKMAASTGQMTKLACPLQNQR